MGVVRQFLGPKSKYIDELPFLYEARVEVVEGLDLTKTIVSDTICRLIGHLESEAIDPKHVEIWEVYSDREMRVSRVLYTSAEGAWLMRPEICRTLEHHYPGHARESNCSFSDRDPEVID